jgi:hypothetical protein
VKEPKKTKSPFKKEGMFNEATPLVFELAKELRFRNGFMGIFKAWHQWNKMQEATSDRNLCC